MSETQLGERFVEVDAANGERMSVKIEIEIENDSEQQKLEADEMVAEGNEPAEDMMPETEIQRSVVHLDRRSVDEKARRVRVAVSSEEPVARSYGDEILDHSEGAIDFSFLASGRAPLLLDHDPEKQIGVVEKVELDRSARRTRATVRFGKGALADEVFRDVVDGIRANISVGYRINKMVREDRDGLTAYRATNWTPLEVSIVSIPADASVGVGRSAEQPSIQIIEERNSAMSEVNLDAVRAEASDAARSAYAKQVQEILALGAKMNKRELADKAIADGLSADQFRGVLLEQMDPRPLVKPAHEVGLNEKERGSYSLLRAIQAASTGKWDKAGFERELSEDIAKRVGKDARGFYVPTDIAWAQRDVQTGTGSGTSKGGYLVGTDHMGDAFIDALRARLVIASLGARVMTGLQGNVAIPKLATATTVAFVAEGNAPTEGAPVFSQVSMSPKTVAGYVDISRRLSIQSDPSVEQILRNDITAQIARKIDQVAIKGGGSNEPVGILGTSGIGAPTSLGANGGAPTFAMLVELEREVAIDNALDGSLAYLTNPKVIAKLRQTPRQSTGVEGNFIMGEAMNLMGYNVASTNLVPSDYTKGSTGTALSAMIFGNFNDLMLGFWSGLDVVVDTASLSTAGGTRIAFFQDVDVAVRNAESFAAAKDIVTA